LAQVTIFVFAARSAALRSRSTLRKAMASAMADKSVALTLGAQDLLSMFGVELGYSEKQLEQNAFQILLYQSFAVVVIVLWSLFSDWQFSSVITLSSAVQVLAYMMLWIQIRKTSSVAGISKNMLLLQVFSVVARLSSTCFYNGYLPTDRSGQHLYQALDLLCLGLVMSLLWAVSFAHKHTYDAQSDSCHMWWMPLAAAAIAFLVHPSLNNSTIGDMYWTTALWLESFSMVPQIWMMSRKRLHGSLSHHFVAATFVARVLVAAFWFHVYPELKLRTQSWNYPGYGVVAAYGLQMLVVSDFMYFYLCKASNGSAYTMGGSEPIVL